MEYEIIWDESAKEFMRSLERAIAKRIFTKVDSIKENPHQFLERLSGYKLYKLRVGDYRAIIDIDEINKEIIIRLAGHRSNIYKILKRAL